MIDHVSNTLIIVIGAYGSGKSEYSINLAYERHQMGDHVILVDLDIVNPYFRSRDVREQFEAFGIEVISPDSHFRHADVPMISPRIRGAIQNTARTVILDVGGDPAGCRALGRFQEEITARGYDMRLVVNTNRPFTSSPEEIVTMMNMLEFTSKLTISRFVSNTNLMEFTDEDVILQGIEIIDKVSTDLGRPFDEFCVLEGYLPQLASPLKGKKKRILHHYLLKPWEQITSIQA